MADLNAGLDLSYSVDQLTPAIVDAMYAAGIRVLGGYLPGPGLANPWEDNEWQLASRGGTMGLIGFCSGGSDPGWASAYGKTRGVKVCVDVEKGIRTDGPWVDPWLAASPDSGLYGNLGVHQGHPHSAIPFRIISNYPNHDPTATWLTDYPPPACPHGRQWRGGNIEWGLNVDNLWLEDFFLAQGDNVQDGIWWYLARVALATRGEIAPPADDVNIIAAQMKAASEATAAEGNGSAAGFYENPATTGYAAGVAQAVAHANAPVPVPPTTTPAPTNPPDDDTNLAARLTSIEARLGDLVTLLKSVS